MSYNKKILAVVSLLSGLASSGSFAANGHYAPGGEGISGASVPPAGLYYRGLAIHYDINTLRDADGNKLPGNNRGEVSALVNRVVWITDMNFLGADYGMEAVVPVQDTSLDFEAAGIQASDSGIGDVFVGPLVLGWHGQQWDAVFAAGQWFDTATFQADEPASNGKGFGTTMLTLGGVWHFDDAKRWNISALSRYEIKTKQQGTDITPGDSWLVEWGIGHRLESGLELGLVGYDAWQLERDEGVPHAFPNDKVEKHAVGLEAGYFWPNIGVGLRGAFYNEYDVVDGPEGNLFRLQFTKAW